MKFYLLLILSAALFLFQACTASAPGPSARQEKDPLIGSIIDARTGSRVTFATLVESLASHDVVYLSEKHDNPMHHAIQHRIISQLAQTGHQPVIGFEFFSVAQTSLLLSFTASKNGGHPPGMEAAMKKEMRKKLGWEDQSDQMWAFYYDLLALARDEGLWASGLDLNASLKRRITRKGVAGLTPLEKDRLFTTPKPDTTYESYMKSIFREVHCGMGSDEMGDRLYDTWLARNDRMALSITELVKAARKADPAKGPVVVIVGNGHTSHHLGIIDRVKRLAPELSQVNLGMTEVYRETKGLDTYLAPLDLEGYPPVPAADYLWFTQRVSNEDPCVKFKKALKKMKAAKVSGS